MTPEQAKYIFETEQNLQLPTNSQYKQQAAVPAIPYRNVPMNHEIFPIPAKAPEPVLTKRELIAAMAMQGMLASGLWDEIKDKDMANVATVTADALIAELNRKQK